MALMLTKYGLDGSPGDLLPFPILTGTFLSLVGIFGFVWSARRYLAPTREMVRWDMWVRVAVVAVYLNAVVVRDAPSVLLTFAVGTLLGVIVARRFLKEPVPAIS